MKKYIFLYTLFFIYSFGLLAQMSEKGATVEKTITETTSKVVLNDLETFKNQFDEWNVGNLHFFSRGENTTDTGYYYIGEKVSPIFQQYLPRNLKKKVVTKGEEPHHIALVRGPQLKDYYILRIDDGKSNNTLVLYELKNQQLQPKKTLAYFYERRGRTFQMDSWMQDLNGDTRLDLIQKTVIKDELGNLKKEKTKVFLRKKNGKFKRSRRTKIEDSDYQLQPIK